MTPAFTETVWILCVSVSLGLCGSASRAAEPLTLARVGATI